ncbi:MAG: hypothetical protein KDE55_05040 [Novosphingobium sp.]|nr:hypothetical protein [Novosphingobium sp.]
MIRGQALFFPVALSLALSACASTGEYPSLARRDAERIKGVAEPVEPDPAPLPIPTPPDAALEARLATLVNNARSAYGRFAANRARAERTISAASGAAMGSESFSVALIALGELDSARGQTMASLSDLDSLYAAERTTNYLTDTGEALAIEQARQQVAEMLAEEDQVIEGLARRLGT